MPEPGSAAASALAPSTPMPLDLRTGDAHRGAAGYGMADARALALEVEVGDALVEEQRDHGDLTRPQC